MKDTIMDMDIRLTRWQEKYGEIANDEPALVQEFCNRRTVEQISNFIVGYALYLYFEDDGDRLSSEEALEMSIRGLFDNNQFTKHAMPVIVKTAQGTEELAAQITQIKNNVNGHPLPYLGEALPTAITEFRSYKL